MKNFTLLAALTLIATIAISQPVITSNPQDASNCPDSCLMLNVAANGVGLNYQWQADEGSGFAHLTSSSATSQMLYVCDAGAVPPSTIDYRCVVTDTNGYRDTSLVATVSLDSCLAPTASFMFSFDQAEACFVNTSTNATTLIWNFGDGDTDNSNNNTPCHDYGTAWIFDVTLYAYNDHGSDEFTLTCDLVGLEEISSNMSVFPNPTNDVVYIQSDERILNVRVINLKGNTLQNQSIAASNFNLSLKDYSPGVYTIVIETNDGLMYQKMIKN
jgi:hypothetical protein